LRVHPVPDRNGLGIVDARMTQKNARHSEGRPEGNRPK
jgi:hypothetical protein